MARQRMAGVFPVRPRRKRQWFRESQPISILSSTTPLEILSISEGEYVGRGFGDPTVVRIRGRVWVLHATASITSTRFVMGIIAAQGNVDPADIFDAGAPSVAQRGADFLWWAEGGVTRQVASVDGNDPAAFQQYDLDVKAMRRLAGTKRLMFVVMNLRDAAVDIGVQADWSVLLQE